ncbi:PAP1-domain-containing protein [Rhizophagus irregularis]|uniref:BZIP domain-containing protein n=4 Tax=Rhizophagus irregularis TaxID=588596 RepID=U9UMD7_RHIID|nr:hypothetical protein GLOIN_2v1541433 [Rhizophagus irregularis DAOM 181602=DAOM 197198]EXX56229.1 Yap1p [Rhizophagus irregularis DAOM 197198w]PKC02806.1 PAP1-domain-containing protein [Rhizophagus irregularis]PKK79171.1 PAP1-domain-containing protein [Rhizophagus irregularis]PKY13527.1 PAP1-domain-containing protein [Rhizophagus irregularis]POG78030.1 hypothetical protein GLOIN_2v1541433 [Rhizophagus irregularis DAOM 181602=DAOM 197198]|eukprot:XP_025184896.1 hypothetical protein GLOIN_2v1541433 [Rhizophagus irregularis DAOM 181602=DAOM 197198]
MDPFFSASTNFDNSNSVFSMNDNNFPWDFTLEDNLEAQKLLAAAIAHNDQYRYDDDQKRKLEMLEDVVQQNPSKVSHNLNISSVPHPDLTAETEAEVNKTGSDVQSEQSTEPQKKKPGRKPLTNTPSSKRKAQNRAAQRAFRERKERYVKELENKIKELESVSAKSAQENQQLKTLVEQLQAENFILKQTSFTFDFPIDKVNDTPLDKDISELLASTPATTSVSKTSTLSIPTSYTPPSSNESDEEPSSPSGTGSVGDSDNNSEIRDTSAGNSPKQVPDTSQIEPTTINPLPSSSQSHSSKPQSAEEFCEKFTDSFCKDKEKNKKSSSTGESSKLPSAFTQYRDPTPFTPNIDNPFSESTPLPPLFEDNFQGFGTFEPMATPSEEHRNPLGGNFGSSLDEISNKRFLSCNKVWERIQQHPKFDDLEGDEIDQLCSALKAKAKCSGNGPVVPEEELEAVLVKLEDK